MEASAIEYRGGRGALDFQHSPLGGQVADCGPNGPHQTEFKQEYGHHNGHPQAAMDHEDIKSCYSSTPSTPPTPMGEEPVAPKVNLTVILCFSRAGPRGRLTVTGHPDATCDL